MIVMKFGGTSVGNPSQIERVGGIVRQRLAHKPIVVVSAAAGITDRLFKLAALAVDPRSREAAEALLEEIIRIQREMLKGLNLAPDLLDREIAEFSDLSRGLNLIRECTPRTRDYLVSFGERFSARIVSAHLRQLGVSSSPIDAPDAGLVTDSRFGCARPIPAADGLIQRSLERHPDLPVITGYIGRTEKGEITTLGRGGSDYSASIFGAAMSVEEIQIWTDVDGVMTADPRIVKEARFLKKLSFAEASELAFYGAKVIHPATMIPAIRQGIPIRVLNTNRPDFEGTIIVDALEEGERGLKSVTSKDHVAVVSVIAAPMLNQYGFMAKISEVFSRYEVVIDMIATSEVSVSMTTDQRADLGPAVRDLSEFSEVTVERDKSIISLVGEGIRNDLGFAARVFDITARHGVPVEMISYGATRLNLSFLTPAPRSREAVAALHGALLAR